MIFAKVKQIRIPNTDQHVVKQRNFLEDNLAICVRNIKHVHDFDIKLYTEHSLLRKLFHNKRVGVGVGGLHAQLVFIHLVLVI